MIGAAGFPLAHVTPQGAQTQLDKHLAAKRSAETMVRYRVKITGHDAPYKWIVECRMPGASNPTNPSNCTGEADTYQGAMLDASEAASGAEWKRLHAATVRYEDLFEAPAEAEPEVQDFQV